MSYIPHTTEQVVEMLNVLGIKNLEDLFDHIPPEIRLGRSLKLKGPFSEPEVLAHLKGVAEKNDPTHVTSFLGGGAYHHYIPSIIPHLSNRPEFVTSYTPYQPEVSQGTLTAMFEFQELTCQLFGMEIANASMYDGATAMAEATLMARRITKRKKVAVSRALHPQYRMVLNTYIEPADVIEIPYNNEGITDAESMKDIMDKDVAALIIQYPNFFGALEDLVKPRAYSEECGALFIVTVISPIALGLLRPPGEYGADIVVGEGQSLGNPVSFGGSHLGLFTTKQKYLRQIPGRIVGETIDKGGRRGFVLTIATREQHIRRGRATSNICSNQSLCALNALIYLTYLGRQGIKEISTLNFLRAEYLKDLLKSGDKIRLKFPSPTFNEFILETDFDLNTLLESLKEDGIIGGIPLERFYPELKNCLLICVTELSSVSGIERYASLVKEYAAGN